MGVTSLPQQVFKHVMHPVNRNKSFLDYLNSKNKQTLKRPQNTTDYCANIEIPQHHNGHSRNQQLQSYYPFSQTNTTGSLENNLEQKREMEYIEYNHHEDPINININNVTLKAKQKKNKRVMLNYGLMLKNQAQLKHSLNQTTINHERTPMKQRLEKREILMSGKGTSQPLQNNVAISSTMGLYNSPEQMKPKVLDLYNSTAKKSFSKNKQSVIEGQIQSSGTPERLIPDDSRNHQIKQLAKGGGGFSLSLHMKQRHQQQQSKEKLQELSEKKIKTLVSNDASQATLISQMQSHIVFKPMQEVSIENQKPLSNEDNQHSRNIGQPQHYYTADIVQNQPQAIRSKVSLKESQKLIKTQLRASQRNLSISDTSMYNFSETSQNPLMSIDQNWRNNFMGIVANNTVSFEPYSEVAQHVKANQLMIDKPLVVQPFHFTHITEALQVKGSRPKTAAQLQNGMMEQHYRRTLANHNVLMQQNVSREQKSLLSKSFRALSRGYTQKVRNTGGIGSSNDQPQFFTKQMNLSTSSQNQSRLRTAKRAGRIVQVANQNLHTDLPTSEQNRNKTSSPEQMKQSHVNYNSMVAVVIPKVHNNPLLNSNDEPQHIQFLKERFQGAQYVICDTMTNTKQRNSLLVVHPSQ